MNPTLCLTSATLCKTLSWLSVSLFVSTDPFLFILACFFRMFSLAMIFLEPMICSSSASMRPMHQVTSLMLPVSLLALPVFVTSLSLEYIHFIRLVRAFCATCKPFSACSLPRFRLDNSHRCSNTLASCSKPAKCVLVTLTLRTTTFIPPIAAQPLRGHGALPTCDPARPPRPA